jgi:hypothetical protein
MQEMGQPPAIRHRFRFSLRMLLVVLTLAAVASWVIELVGRGG